MRQGLGKALGPQMGEVPRGPPGAAHGCAPLLLACQGLHLAYQHQGLHGAHQQVWG